MAHGRLHGKIRRILMITAFAAMMTAGGTGLAIASSDFTGSEPVETGYMVVDSGSGPSASPIEDEDCPWDSGSGSGPAELAEQTGSQL